MIIDNAIGTGKMTAAEEIKAGMIRQLYACGRSRADILADAVSTFGRAAQTCKAIDELAELIQALAKAQVSGDTEDASLCEHIREEIVDADIMLEQLKIIYGFNRYMERYKLDRLNGIIGGGAAATVKAASEGGGDVLTTPDALDDLIAQRKRETAELLAGTEDNT